MSQSLEYLHVHELQALLKKVDKNEDPKRFAEIQAYIEKGGYQTPLESKPSSGFKIASIHFKVAVIAILGLLFFSAAYGVMSGSMLALIFLVLYGYALFTIFTESAGTDLALSLVAYVQIFFAAMSVFFVAYGTSLLSNILDIGLGLAIGVFILWGSERYLQKMVYAE